MVYTRNSRYIPISCDPPKYTSVDDVCKIHLRCVGLFYLIFQSCNSSKYYIKIRYIAQSKHNASPLQRPNYFGEILVPYSENHTNKTRVKSVRKRSVIDT